MRKREAEQARERSRRYNLAEFEALVVQVRKGRERFIARLERWIETVDNPKLGTPCKLWIGNHQLNGYPRMNVKVYGKHVQLLVHRMFLMLKLQRPIRPLMEAGHECHTPTCVSHVREMTRKRNLGERDARAKQKVPF